MSSIPVYTSTSTSSPNHLFSIDSIKENKNAKGDSVEKTLYFEFTSKNLNDNSSEIKNENNVIEKEENNTDDDDKIITQYNEDTKNSIPKNKHNRRPNFKSFESASQEQNIKELIANFNNSNKVY